MHMAAAWQQCVGSVAAAWQQTTRQAGHMAECSPFLPHLRACMVGALPQGAAVQARSKMVEEHQRLGAHAKQERVRRSSSLLRERAKEMQHKAQLRAAVAADKIRAEQARVSLALVMCVFGACCVRLKVLKAVPACSC